MRLKKVTSLAAFLCLLIFSVSVLAADPPSGFRNGKWGSVPAASLKKYSGPTTDGTSIYVPQEENKSAPFLGVPVNKELYMFSNGKLYGGSVFLEGRENFDAMKVALIKLYGQPAFANDRTEIYKWKWPNTQIEVHFYYNKNFAQATVTYLNHAI